MRGLKFGDRLGKGLGQGFGKGLGKGLGRLVSELAQHRKTMDAAMKSGGFPMGAPGQGTPTRPSRLTEVTGFGSNPGNLRMFTYVPDQLPANPALVVVLHGCTQTAAGYDIGAGWSTLADRYGFVLLMPEQQAANNPKTCFTWFQPADTTRDQGEALSIRQMVERAASDHEVDRKRIFVTGLSAGGAMTSVLLAAYPDVFAGGAIIAGLPFGAAGNVQQAFESMFQGKSRPAREWGDLVRRASPHRGPWPRVSVWHGTADATVKHSNAGEILKQWTDVHGLKIESAEASRVDGTPRKVWRSADGTEIIEEYTLPGMAHGTPLAIAGAEDALGEAGPFMLDVGIASSYHIARFWGLTERRRAEASQAERPIEMSPESSRAPAGSVIPLPDESGGGAEKPERERIYARVAPDEPLRDTPPRSTNTVNDIITKALRAAGLMKG